MLLKYKKLKILTRIQSIILLLFLCSCSSNKDIEAEYIERGLNAIYKSALLKLAEDDFKQATIEFDEVERQHPYSNWAKKAIIMSSYSSYKSKDYIKTEANLKRFLNLYPASEFAPYAQYLLGINYFDEIIEINRDQTAVKKALEVFKLIMDRYPNSNYAKDAYFKIIYLENNLAAKELDVAMTYFSLKKYIAATKRFNRIINSYQTTTYVPEVLHRLVEVYLILGIKEEAIVNARVLGYNYPNSKWYKLSYQLLKKNKILIQKN